MEWQDEMNSREPILDAVNRQPIDRVPTDIWATDDLQKSKNRDSHF